MTLCSSRSPQLVLRRLHSSRRLPSPHSRVFPSATPFSRSSFSSRPLPRSPLKATPNFWTVGLATGLLLGASLFFIPSASPQLILSLAQERIGDAPVDPEDIKLVDSESIAMALKIAPGRVGNLTADQEAKLKELWTATLRVFGVSARVDSDSIGNVDGTEDSDSRSGLGHHGSGKKKRRLPLLGKKKDKSESGSSTPKSTTDADDKYGQTKDFEQALASRSPEDLRRTFWSMVKHDHPDNLLLRFLRARKWDVEKALVMMISTMHWRLQDMHVDDDIMKRGEGGAVEDSTSSDPAVKKEGEDFLAQLRLGKSYLHGVDKEGRPMCFVRVRLHKAGEQSESSLERYTVFVIETARLVLATPVDTAAIVFDMTGFSMANMDYAPVKFMIKCFEANYPESLGVVLVHKAPWIFQGIWSIIKGWLDPVVASKIHFTKNVDELADFVPRDHIPKEVGGDEDWEYRYVEPENDENATMKDEKARDDLLLSRLKTVEEFERATQRWLALGKAVETPMSKEIKEERHALAEKLRVGYWELDPYLRARSYYDRTGTIAGKGMIEFYPKTEGEKKVDTGKVDVDVDGRDEEKKNTDSAVPLNPTTVTNGEKEKGIPPPHEPHEDDVD